MGRAGRPATLQLYAEIRERRAGFVLLVVLVGLAAGITMAIAAGARRSDRAYERFLAWSDNPELATEGVDESHLGVRETLQDPAVVDSVHVEQAMVAVVTSSGMVLDPFELAAIVDVDGRIGAELPRTAVIRGRRAAPDAPDEATIGFAAAEALGLHVGDRIAVRPVQPQESGGASGQDRDDVPIRIAGIEARPGEFPSINGTTQSVLLLTAAFGQRHPELVDSDNRFLLIRLRAGSTKDDVDRLIAAHDVLYDWSAPTADIERTIRLETIALTAAAAMVGLVGFVLVAQLFRREVASMADAHAVLRAMGFDRRRFLVLGLLRGACLGLPAVVLAVVVAVAVSPRFPVGLARIADRDVGFHADWPVLALGAIVVLVVVLAVAVVSAARGEARLRLRPGLRRPPGRPLLALPGRSPAIIAGLELATRGAPRSRRGGSHVTSYALCIVVAALVAVVAMVASFGRLMDHRELSGATWDAAYFPTRPNLAEPVVAEVLDATQRTPGVAAATTIGFPDDRLRVNGTDVELQIFGEDRTIGPAIARGRQPTATGEVALGAKVLRHLGLRVGDNATLQMSSGGPEVNGVVVGEAVLGAPPWGGVPPGDGSAITASTAEALGLGVGEAQGGIVARFDRAVDADATFRAVTDRLAPIDSAFRARDRSHSVGLDRLMSVPILMVVVLGLLAAGTVAHLLLTTVRGRGQHLAVLRALGFTNFEVRASVGVYALVVTLVTCIVGMLCGLLLGRLAWLRVAGYFYVVPRPQVALGAMVVLAAAAAAVAIASSQWPASQVVHEPVATVLRRD